MNRKEKEPDQRYFDRRCTEETTAANVAGEGPAARVHRELAVRYAIRAASIRGMQDQLGLDR